MHIYIENEIPMSAEELWQTMHTPEFDAFVAKEYGLSGYIELERLVSDNMLKRRVRIVSTIDRNYMIQSLARKILGQDKLIYEEIQEKCLDRYEMCWRIIPPVFPEKFDAYGTLRLIPEGRNRCIRVREGMIQVRLPGVDGLMKMIAAVQSEKTKDRFPQVVEKWKSQTWKLQKLVIPSAAALSAVSEMPISFASRILP
jgi:hypothetical protein